MTRKKRNTGREIMGTEFWERHERTQQMLADRIRHHQVRAAEERAAKQRTSRLGREQAS
jgi:hypothetical protein